MDWTSWIPVLILSVALFFGRHLFKASIEKSIQHTYDEKIENLRTELRQNEERVRSELRSKEMELSSLRDGLLTGRANRQALLDKRRLEAVERVWTTVMQLAPYKATSMMLARINVEAAAKAAPGDPKVRKLFEFIGTTFIKSDKPPDNPAINEKPFLSPLAWAYFSAYQTIVLVAYMQVKALEIGIEDSQQFFKMDDVKNVLKEALPHQSKFIDDYDIGAYSLLLDELEENLLVELRKMLVGSDVDEASLAQSKRIMDAVNKLETERSAQMAKSDGIEAGI